jgi:hypothetical protein
MRKDQGYDSIAKGANVTDTTFSYEQAMALMRRVCDASRTEVWPELSGNEIHVLVNLAAQEAKNGGAA